MSENYVAWKVAGQRVLLSWLSILLLGTVLLVPRVGIAERSIYTSLEKKCWNTKYQGQSARECMGVRGWRLLIVYEPERSYLVLRKKGYEKNLRDDIFSEEIGHFPEIRSPRKGTDLLAEWRLDSQGRPRALIFRVFGVDPKKSLQEDPNPYKSSLIIVRLDQPACVLGIVNDNERARLLADSNTQCEKAP
jgi:hypothetical protein